MLKSKARRPRRRGYTGCADAFLHRPGSVNSGKGAVHLMHRTRTSNVLMVLGACCLGLAAWALTMATGPAAVQVKSTKAPNITVVNLTAGLPSELAFNLSTLSSLPVGKL